MLADCGRTDRHSSPAAQECWNAPADLASAWAFRQTPAVFPCGPLTATSKGRSGTADGQVYLVSPETAVAAALTGEITDPMLLGTMPQITMPETFQIDDSAVLAPASADEAGVKHRNSQRTEHQAFPGQHAAGRYAAGTAGTEGRRQYHNRPYHAGRLQDPAVPLQYSTPVAVLLRRLRYHISGKSEGSRNQHHCRRQQLRAGALRESTRRWSRCIWV